MGVEDGGLEVCLVKGKGWMRLVEKVYARLMNFFFVAKQDRRMAGF